VVKIDDERKVDPCVVDYRVRCEVDNGPFVRIYYGVTAAEYDGPGAERPRDVKTDYANLSEGLGRMRAREPELPHQKFFFTEYLRCADDLQDSRLAVRATGPRKSGEGEGRSGQDQAARARGADYHQGGRPTGCALGYPISQAKEVATED
jgi:hypothetical protein